MSETMMKTRMPPLLLCLLLLILRGESKPTGMRNRVHQEEALSELEHDDEKNYYFDHEVFLGKEDAKVFTLLTPEESKQRLSIIVDKMDVDNDGAISLKELSLWVKHARAKNIFREVQNRWKEFDANEDGMISWDEYKNTTYGLFLAQPELADHDHTRMAQRDERRFRAADRNGDMMADLKEFTNFIYPDSFPHMRHIVVQEAIEDLDRNNDGVIDENEYIGDVITDADTDKDLDWMTRERQAFKESKDKNKDGVMDKKEIQDLIFPPDYDFTDVEARHLVNTTDANKDGKLTKEEILDKYQVFVGSHVTNYGKALHDEF